MLPIKTLTYVSTHTTLGGCSVDLVQESDQYKSIKTKEVKVKLVFVELSVIDMESQAKFKLFQNVFSLQKGVK